MTIRLILLVLAALTAAATFSGGLFALRYKDKSHLILGFSAGAVIGLAFFDLLPESIKINGSGVTTLVAIGFLLYLILDRALGLHVHGSGPEPHEHHNRSILRAASLSTHSLLDGIAIGLSFQYSLAVGTLVAVAVLSHDFSDGINTVAAILKGGGTVSKMYRWLVIDALAPVVGIVSTFFFTVPETALGGILALFCGFFLYIGASDLIPESYHVHPKAWTTIATIGGAGFIFFVIRLIG